MCATTLTSLFFALVTLCDVNKGGDFLTQKPTNKKQKTTK